MTTTIVFPQAQVQTCIVHLIRHSLAFVFYKDRKTVAAGLKHIYRAQDAAAGKAALDGFAEGAWGQKVPRHRAVLAAALDGGGALLCLPGGRPPDHLYDQCH